MDVFIEPFKVEGVGGSQGSTRVVWNVETEEPAVGTTLLAVVLCGWSPHARPAYIIKTRLIKKIKVCLPPSLSLSLSNYLGLNVFKRTWNV